MTGEILSTPAMEEKALWINLHEGIDKLNSRLSEGWTVKLLQPLNVAVASTGGQAKLMESSVTSLPEDNEKPVWFQSDVLVILERQKQ